MSLSTNTHYLLSEILKKENERFKLDKIGFIRNLTWEIDYILSTLPLCKIPPENLETFRKWKFSLLEEYYERKRFSDFVSTHLEAPSFRKMVFDLFQTILKYRYAHEPRTETDRYLAPAGETLSYLLCQERPSFYKNYFTPSSLFNSPSRLHSYCQEICQKIFPLSTAMVIDFLKQNNKPCWEKLCIRLKTLTEIVTKNKLQSYNDDAIQDIWTETCFELKKALQQEKLQQDTPAQSVIAYAAGIVQNKIREFFRKQKKDPYLFIENWDQETVVKNSGMYTNTAMENSVRKDFLNLQEIDQNNEYEFQMALSCILYDQTHPQHRELTEGMEDKINTLMAHYLKNQSYEEIAKEKYGILSDKDLQKRANKLRQDVSRVKIKIKERFQEILSSKKKGKISG